MTCFVPHAPATRIFFCMRDPTEKDLNVHDTIWVSKEYIPHRIFRGGNGEWKFIGKFYPEEPKCV